MSQEDSSGLGLHLPQCHTRLKTYTAPEEKAWPEGCEAHVKGAASALPLPRVLFRGSFHFLGFQAEVPLS